MLVIKDKIAMKKTAVIFPGQGSQREGMGKDFYESFPAARKLYDEASSVLEVDIAAISFAEEDPRLHLTEYTQPAILANEIVIYTVLREETDFKPEIFAGHSLGEYTALVAAGVLNYADALRIVSKRGQLMQAAFPNGKGAMSAVKLEDLEAKNLPAILSDCDMEIGNLNSRSQIVISGVLENVKAAEARLTSLFSDVEIVPLPVSAPFHSRYMKSIEPEFGDYLRSFSFDKTRASSVLSNFTGSFHEGDTLVDNLIRQISSPVRWTDNMRILHDVCGEIIEAGPGRPLGGFFLREGYDAPPSVVTTRCLKKLQQSRNIKVTA